MMMHEILEQAEKLRALGAFHDMRLPNTVDALRDLEFHRMSGVEYAASRFHEAEAIVRYQAEIEAAYRQSAVYEQAARYAEMQTAAMCASQGICGQLAAINEASLAEQQYQKAYEVAQWPLSVAGIAAAHVGALDAVSCAYQPDAATDVLRRIHEEYEARYRSPAASEILAYFERAEEANILAASGRFSEQWLTNGELLHAMAAMRQPWLDASDPVRSFAGFAELQNIGHVLQTQPAFSDGVSDCLRASLGDWQASLDYPSSAFEDSLSRSDIYLAKGLNPALTNYPTRAFFESTAIAGLLPVSPQGKSRKGKGKRRTNDAHGYLMRFEIKMRRFIVERMTSAFGAAWIKQRVPGDMRIVWEEKRDKAIAAGRQEMPLIDYADFTDYLPIIIKKDNWDGAFASVFNRKTLVQESLQRLYPIRIDTMHARVISKDDYLYLFAETKRLLQAIKCADD